MRIKINLSSNEQICFPKGYLKYNQAFIYNLLDRLDANWLHEKGFVFEKRAFKLFTYSDFLEKRIYDREKEVFIFKGRSLSFYVSSPVDWILQQTAANVLKSELVRIGSNLFTIDSVSVMKEPEFSESVLKISTLSPITMHSTIEQNGRKFTLFHTPFEEPFSELINRNLQKKWTALHNEDCRYNISIKPLFNDEKHQKITYFGTNKQTRTLIKAWAGRFEISSEPEFLKFALNAGLGARNSQGYGMAEVV